MGTSAARSLSWPTSARGRDGLRSARGQASPHASFVPRCGATFAAARFPLLILFGFGQALGARAKHQRAADLAAVSGAQVMRREYPRLFEPATLEGGVPNPGHLSDAAYLALTRAAALRGARRNGVSPGRVGVSFPDVPFAPTRITVVVRGEANVSLPDARRSRRARIEVRARATAEVVADASAFGMPTQASGGGYGGPLA